MLIGLALLAAVAGVYGRTTHYGLVFYDDDLYGPLNPEVRQGLTPPALTWAWTARVGFWHPLTWMSLQLDAVLAGDDAGGFHRTNLLLHAANVLGLFLVLRRMTGAVGRSAVVAGLFALHPLNVESVAWVAERKGLLSTFFWILAMGAYAGYAARPGVGRYLLVVLAMVLGLLAKPMLVTLPCVLLLLDYWPLGRLRWNCSPNGARAPPVFAPASATRLILEKLPLLAVAAAFSVVAVSAEQNVGALGWLHVPLPMRLANAGASYLTYLRKTIWPVDLAPFYPYPVGFPLVTVAGAVLLLALISGAALWQWRRPYLLVGWLWYVGTLVPVIGLVPVGQHSMADRYAYVPLIGIFIMLVWSGADLLRRFGAGWLAAPVTGLALGGCAAMSWFQVGSWHDPVALWTHTLAVTGDNAVAHNSLGVSLSAARPEAALGHFREAIRIDPGNVKAYLNLGMLLGKQRRYAPAADAFAAVVRLEPDNLGARVHLAQLLLHLGKVAEAGREFEEILRRDPDNADAHLPLGLLRSAEGKSAEAARHFRAADRVAWNLATDPDPARRDGAHALVLAQQLCQATNNREARYLDTLAAAYAEVGQFSAAVAAAQRAMSSAAPPLARAIQERLYVYEQGSAFRGAREMAE